MLNKQKNTIEPIIIKEDNHEVQIEKKSFNNKILSYEEFNVCEVIKEFEISIYSIITNIFILLKNNDIIYHINNYVSYNYDINNIIKDNIPIMILLGGSSYKIYSLFYNKYFKDIIDVNDYLINSIDYDFSIIVKKNFNKNTFKDIINLIINNNMNEFININNNNKLQKINKNDIDNDFFLNNKKIIKFKKNNEELENILLTYSDSGNDYLSIQINIKIEEKIYQIIELLFWRNELISNLIYLKDFDINKCVLFQTNKFKILLPDITMLLKTNINSMKSRLQNKEFNKCAKDYYRLKFIELINDKKYINKDNIKNEYIKLSIKNINKIYKKDNPNIFKLPYSICSLQNKKEQEKFFELYEKFLNLELKEQIDILSNNIYLKK